MPFWNIEMKTGYMFCYLHVLIHFVGELHKRWYIVAQVISHLPQGFLITWTIMDYQIKYVAMLALISVISKVDLSAKLVLSMNWIFRLWQHSSGRKIIFISTLWTELEVNGSKGKILTKLLNCWKKKINQTKNLEHHWWLLTRSF